MDRQAGIEGLSGLYVTMATMFRDSDLELDLEAMRQHVRFLLKAGLTRENSVWLVGGAAGDFSTMTFEERIQVTETYVEEVDGKIPIVMGAQTTSTRELVKLAQAAERLGAEYIQVSPPYYWSHTEDDVYEYFLAAAEAADIGLVLYNTFYASSGVSLALIDRMAQIPNVVGLKWAAEELLVFEQATARFAEHFCVIDNQVRFVSSHIMGARGIELHLANFWPEWAVMFWDLLQDGKYVQAQQEITRVVMPFYQLWKEMLEYTAGDGYLEKLCLELRGHSSSRCRPPTRDVRDRFREKARKMLLEFGVPNVSQS